jgi:hypothetical protein
MARHSLITLSSTNAKVVSTPAVHSGEDITIQNVDPEAVVYLGGSNVSPTNYGFILTPGAAWSVELPPKNSIYAVSGTNGSKVAVIKVSLEYQK